MDVERRLQVSEKARVAAERRERVSKEACAAEERRERASEKAHAAARAELSCFRKQVQDISTAMARNYEEAVRARGIQRIHS